MQGVSHRHLSDHLSDLTETTLSDLEQSKIIAIDDDTQDLEALNAAMISSYYYIAYTTIELFQSSLTEKTKLKGLLEIISAASEFDDLLVRPGDEDSVERLLRHAKLSISKPDYTDPHTKANALIQVCVWGIYTTPCFGVTNKCTLCVVMRSAMHSARLLAAVQQCVVPHTCVSAPPLHASVALTSMLGKAVLDCQQPHQDQHCCRLLPWHAQICQGT